MGRKIKSKRILIKTIPGMNYSSISLDGDRIYLCPGIHPPKYYSYSKEKGIYAGFMNIWEQREDRLFLSRAVLLLTKDEVRKNG